MANWKFKIDIKDLHDAYKNKSIGLGDVAQGVADRLQPVIDEIKKVFNQYYVKGTLVEYYFFPFKIFKRKVIYFFYHLRGLYFYRQWKRYLIKKKIQELALSCKKLKR
jgi:hypothetical protein